MLEYKLPNRSVIYQSDVFLNFLLFYLYIFEESTLSFLHRFVYLFVYQSAIGAKKGFLEL